MREHPQILKGDYNMKKIIALLLSLTMMACLFAGCAGGNEANNDTTDYSTMTIEELKPLLKTITAGKLTMVTSPDFAPYEFYALDAEGNPTLAGFDIALAGYIATYLGLELEIVTLDFNGTITELGAGKADIGMAGYSPDPAREGAMSFSMIYYTSGQSFIASTATKDLFTDLASANKAEYQIGAQLGSIQAKLAKEHTPDADIVELAKVTNIIAEVVGGKLDGAFVEKVVAETYAEQYDNLEVLFEVPYNTAGTVVGVNKNNPALLAAVNLALASAIEDGSFNQYVVEALELSTGDKYEGLLDNGEVPNE